MLRTIISLRFCRTWNATKKALALRDYLLVYAHFHMGTSLEMFAVVSPVRYRDTWKVS
jgi:hypothetical protein